MSGSGTGGSEISKRLAEVRKRIAAAAAIVGRRADDVTLVAVGKTQSSDRLTEALASGHRVFGENRVQEARAKWQALRGRFAGVDLHLIGPLQTNKVRDALALFDVIETIDRERLARAIAAELEQSKRPLRCLIQINTGEEPQKAGVAPMDADDFIDFCRGALKLPVVGLMCIPPLDDNPAPHFALLVQIARRHRLELLSMGMSGDYETAIRLGATHVRIGSAIFGERPMAD